MKASADYENVTWNETLCPDRPADPFGPTILKLVKPLTVAHLVRIEVKETTAIMSGHVLD